VLCVGAFTLGPGFLRRLPGVGAVLDDLRHGVAEPGTNIFETRATALVFRRVVQQRGNRFVLVPAIVQNDRRNAEHVRDVRGAGAFARLSSVDLARVSRRLIEPFAERRHLGILTEVQSCAGETGREHNV